MEPDLAPIFSRAVYKPGWNHVVDPHRVVTGLAERFQRDGGEIRRGRVTAIEVGAEGPRAVVLEDGARLQVERLVIAAGAWSHKLAERLGSRVPLESERGYHATLPAPGVRLNRVIEVGGHRFVIVPMAMGLRVAGTVEFAGLQAPPDYRRARRLVEKAARVLPGLNGEGASEWMGHRPSTPDSLPVIGPSPHVSGVYYAFGHGHLGLTFAATTARMIADMIAGRPAPVDPTPYRIDRF